MTPLEKIKTGIQNCDLHIIQDGYKCLTGEYVEITVGEHDDHQKLRELTKYVSKINDILSINQIDISKKKRKKKTIKRKHKQEKQKEQEEENEVIEIKGGSNRYSNGEPTVFVTEDIDEEEKNKQIEINNKRIPMMAKRRERPLMFDVECSECGNTFKSNIRSSKDIGKKCKYCLKKMHEQLR